MRGLILLIFTLASSVYADTIDHYMNIANNIPQMEMKADSQSQAWARSARNILVLTSESIMESLNLANDNAKSHGSPLFCLPPSIQLSPESVNDLIQQTYKEIPGADSEKNKMTVSQVALVGLSKKYPCQAPTTAATPSNAPVPIPSTPVVSGANIQMQHVGNGG